MLAEQLPLMVRRQRSRVTECGCVHFYVLTRVSERYQELIVLARIRHVSCHRQHPS